MKARPSGDKITDRYNYQMGYLDYLPTDGNDPIDNWIIAHTEITREYNKRRNEEQQAWEAKKQQEKLEKELEKELEKKLEKTLEKTLDELLKGFK